MRAYIALGSNLNNPVYQLQLALQALQALPSTKIQRVSHFYQNPPMGPQDQPNFVNAVAALDTSLEPLILLEKLQKIEKQQGRNRDIEQRWGPRTLDLDILLYADSCMNTEKLILPHPGLTERCFFLVPLYEIAPDLILPNGELLKIYVLDTLKDGLKCLKTR